MVEQESTRGHTQHGNNNKTEGHVELADDVLVKVARLQDKWSPLCSAVNT